MNSPFPASSLPNAINAELTGDLCLANAHVLLPDRVVIGALTIEQGMISDITEGEHVPTGAVNCAGDLLIPGLVELHTDNVERHIEPRPAVDWPPSACFARP